MEHIFREYDIRGIFSKNLTKTNTQAIGHELGCVIKKSGAKSVAIGFDAREHSPILAQWLNDGLVYSGLKVFSMGMVPTPINYFAGFTMDIGSTIMITGSHNPPEYNGFKITINKNPFFGNDIYTLGDSVGRFLKQNIDIPTAFEPELIDVKSRYIDYMCEHFSNLKSNKTPFVVDCGNGVGGIGFLEIAKKLNLNVKFLFENPDGTFPNHHPDPSEDENLQYLKEELRTNKYKLGFAFDGDADRIAVLTEKYNIKGDLLALIFAKNMNSPSILGEVKCSQIMYDEVNKIGKAYMYKTGHSNLKKKMQDIKIDLAAEVSGHLFFADRYFGYDDAIYALLRTLELFVNGVDFDSEIDKLPNIFSTDEIKVKTTEDMKFSIIKKLETNLSSPPSWFPIIKEIINVDGVRVVFEDGWGLVRASNTTPVLVTRFESSTEEKALEYQSALMRLLEESK